MYSFQEILHRARCVCAKNKCCVRMHGGEQALPAENKAPPRLVELERTTWRRADEPYIGKENFCTKHLHEIAGDAGRTSRSYSENVWYD